jgi:hypothetical protein
MGQIIRVTAPAPEQYEEASRLAAEQWPATHSLHRPERFAAFRRLGVELVLAREGEHPQGVAFLLPDRYRSRGGEHRFVWLFRVYARPEAKNLGALMLMRLMQWYPAILGIGITPAAAKLYETLRWRQYPDVWRCVHPISLQAMTARYADRLAGSWQAPALRFLGRGYDRGAALVEACLKPGLAVEHLPPAPPGGSALPADLSPRERKLALAATYLPRLRLTRKGRVLEAYVIMGAGRIVRDDFRGPARLWAHVKLWQELRRLQASFSEYLATSAGEARRALGCGYIPLRMPIYYWDKDQTLGGLFAALEQSDFSFADCDKLL